MLNTPVLSFLSWLNVMQKHKPEFSIMNSWQNNKTHKTSLNPALVHFICLCWCISACPGTLEPFVDQWNNVTACHQHASVSTQNSCSMEILEVRINIYISIYIWNESSDTLQRVSEKSLSDTEVYNNLCIWVYLFWRAFKDGTVPCLYLLFEWFVSYFTWATVIITIYNPLLLISRPASGECGCPVGRSSSFFGSWTVGPGPAGQEWSYSLRA